MAWKNSSPNDTCRGYTALRGTYNVAVNTTTVEEDTGDRVRTVGDVEEAEGGYRVQEEEDEWLLSYVLAPPAVSGLCN